MNRGGSYGHHPGSLLAAAPRAAHVDVDADGPALGSLRYQIWRRIRYLSGPSATTPAIDDQEGKQCDNDEDGGHDCDNGARGQVARALAFGLR